MAVLDLAELCIGDFGVGMRAECILLGDFTEQCINEDLFSQPFTKGRCGDLWIAMCRAGK